MDPDTTLEAAEIQYGECLTALVLQPQLASAVSAFALWCHGHSTIVIWGRADYGGNSSPVKDQLKGVEYKPPRWPIAAILALAVPNFGGDSSAVRNRSAPAFAALLCRGRISSAQKGSKGVEQIQATDEGPWLRFVRTVTVTVRQFKRKVRLGLFSHSPVFFATWECLSCQTEIIFFGAPPRAGLVDKKDS